MATIIVGHFDQLEHLQEATRLLEGLGFKPSDYAAYYLNPPGRQGLFVLMNGRAQPADEGEYSLRTADGSTQAGIDAYVIACAAVTSSIAAPNAPVMPDRLPCALILAIKAISATREAIAVTILGHSVANRIDRAHGRWEHGSWIDLDRREPVMPLLERSS